MSDSYISQRNIPSFNEGAAVIAQQSESFFVADSPTDEIGKRLLCNEDVDVSKVHVSVSELAGSSNVENARFLVTLSGSVLEDRQREIIEALVVSCHGVARIDNQLGVVPDGAS